MFPAGAERGKFLFLNMIADRAGALALALRRAGRGADRLPVAIAVGNRVYLLRVCRSAAFTLAGEGLDTLLGAGGLRCHFAIVPQVSEGFRFHCIGS